MPRRSDRSINLDYRPSPPVMGEASIESVVRTVWDELLRIAVSMAGIDQPAGSATYCSEPVTISKAPTIVWDRLFDEGVIEKWSKPANAMNTTTGVYTITQEGIYNLFIRLSAPAFSTPANKQYYAGIRVTFTFADGSPPTVFETYNGGFDTVPLTVFAASLWPLSQGDTITVDGFVDHETKTGTVTVNAGFQIHRVSGIGDNTA